MPKDSAESGVDSPQFPNPLTIVVTGLMAKARWQYNHSIAEGYEDVF